MRGQHSARFLLGAYLRHVRDAIRHHAEKHAGQPERQNAKWVKDDGLLEVGHLFCRQSKDENMRKRYGRKGDERVTKEVKRRDALARQQGGEGGRGKHCLRGGAISAHSYSDNNQRCSSEEHKQSGLKSVDPGCAAHAAEKDVAHYDQGDDAAAEPVRHQPSADGIQRRAAAHDADDDVWHQQGRLHDGNDRADVTTLPTIAKHLNRCDEAVLFAQRPDSSADEE